MHAHVTAKRYGYTAYIQYKQWLTQVAVQSSHKTHIARLHEFPCWSTLLHLRDFTLSTAVMNFSIIYNLTFH